MLPGASGPGAQGPPTPSLGQASPSFSAGCSPRDCAGRLRHPRITAPGSLPALSPFNSVAQFGAVDSGGGVKEGGRFVMTGICRSK